MRRSPRRRIAEIGLQHSQQNGTPMDIVTQFPRQVREIENLFITLSDGCRLAARIWLPARRRKEWKAVISLCSTADRYNDDIHFMGGTLLNDNLHWASVMLAYMARTPDKALLGDAWRETWLNRQRNEPLLVANWLKHQ